MTDEKKASSKGILGKVLGPALWDESIPDEARDLVISRLRLAAKIIRKRGEESSRLTIGDDLLIEKEVEKSEDEIAGETSGGLSSGRAGLSESGLSHVVTPEMVEAGWSEMAGYDPSDGPGVTEERVGLIYRAMEAARLAGLRVSAKSAKGALDIPSNRKEPS